jgi:DNA-binding transcriptional LysR family regulator
MNKIDHLALDGRALQLFLAVLSEGSVTAAAARLGVTQSAVSHALDKLRAIAGDPLFVKSGRGIVATAHAHALAEQARALLDEMKAFAAGARFEPADARLSFTIAANDFQRDLLLPALLRCLATRTVRTDLRVIPSGLPTAAMLREGHCDLLITPRPPAGVDILQKLLFRDRYLCFFDPKHRAAPRSLKSYLAARHVTVIYPDNERLEFDKRMSAAKIERDISVSVPNFYGVPAFLRGTDMLASVPGLLRLSIMKDFASAPVPLRSGRAALTELPLFMTWHQRFQGDPAHRWLREQLTEVTRDVLAAA